jgi:hypothetical protein
MLLANLLRTLSEEEIARVRAGFRLPERSMLLFERIAASANKPPDSKELAKALHITIENLYVLTSDIVEECVRILVPHEEFAALNFFKGKYLNRPFITEALRVEKRLLSRRDKNDLGRFYKYIFNSLATFPINLIDANLMEKYGNKWHKVKENPPVDDDFAILMRVNFVRIHALPGKKKMNLEQMSKFSRNLLDRNSERALSSPNPLVRYEYFQAEWKACAYQRIDASVRLTWLERSLAVIHEHPTLFEEEQEEIVEIQIANELALFNEKPKEALETYKKYYRGQTPHTTRDALYLIQFCRVAFLARDFDTSKRVLTGLLSHQVTKVTPSIYINALLIKALLEVTESSSDAGKTITLAKSEISENYSLAFEIQIRGLETANAFKERDFELADQLSIRNMKWLRSRQLALSKSAWIYFYQIISAIIQYKMTKEPIRTSVLKHFKNNFGTEHPEFFILLESEIENITKK